MVLAAQKGDCFLQHSSMQEAKKSPRRSLVSMESQPHAVKGESLK